MGQALPETVKNRDESEYLAAIREHEPAATAEIAEAVDVTRQGADYRLRRLEEEGKVRHKMAGNSLIWFVADQADESESSEGEQ